MKIKVLSLNTKTALATAVYYLAIVVLLVLLGMVVLRFVFSPPCSIIAKNECLVDGWSVAGLAGTVLAVAATLLAVLGAIAVAYWWLSLNEKVDRRVDEQIKTAIDQALKEQEKKISDQTIHLLQEQEKKFGETFSNTQKEMDSLKELASDIERRVEWSIEQLIIAITQLDPWIIEQWASEYMLLSPSSGVAARMVRRYLQFVDGFFPSDPNDVSAITKHLESLKNRSAPSQNPIYYWEKALAWQREINPQLQPTYAETVRDNIEKRRVNMELWKKQRGL